MLNTLKASKRSCRLMRSPIGTLLNMEKSMLTTCGPRKTLRPRFPNAPEGTPNAQGLNQLADVYTASAALPPCEMVNWHFGSGFAATGPATNGSANRFGRAYVPGPPGALPLRLATSPLTCRLYGAPERAWKM